jgi:hypothetical protein
VQLGGDLRCASLTPSDYQRPFSRGSALGLRFRKKILLAEELFEICLLSVSKILLKAKYCLRKEEDQCSEHKGQVFIHNRQRSRPVAESLFQSRHSVPHICLNNKKLDGKSSDKF